MEAGDRRPEDGGRRKETGGCSNLGVCADVFSGSSSDPGF